jgi:hypothetical protein
MLSEEAVGKREQPGQFVAALLMVTVVAPESLTGLAAFGENKPSISSVITRRRTRWVLQFEAVLCSALVLFCLV